MMEYKGSMSNEVHKRYMGDTLLLFFQSRLFDLDEGASKRDRKFGIFIELATCQREDTGSSFLTLSLL